MKKLLLLLLFLSFSYTEKLFSIGYLAFKTAMTAHINTGENLQKLPRLFNIYAELNDSDQALARRCAAENGYGIDLNRRTLVKQTASSSSSSSRFRSAPTHHEIKMASTECTLAQFIENVESKLDSKRLYKIYRALSTEDQIVAIEFACNNGYCIDDFNMYAQSTSDFERTEGADPEWTLGEFIDYLEKEPSGHVLYEIYHDLNPEDQTVAIQYAFNNGYSFDPCKRKFIKQKGVFASSSSSTHEFRDSQRRSHEKEEKSEEPEAEYTVNGFLQLTERIELMGGNDSNKEIVEYYNKLTDEDRADLKRINERKAMQEAEAAFGNCYSPRGSSQTESSMASSSSSSSDLSREKAEEIQPVESEYTASGFLELNERADGKSKDIREVIAYYNNLSPADKLKLKKINERKTRHAANSTFGKRHTPEIIQLGSSQMTAEYVGHTIDEFLNLLRQTFDFEIYRQELIAYFESQQNSQREIGKAGCLEDNTIECLLVRFIYLNTSNDYHNFLQKCKSLPLEDRQANMKILEYYINLSLENKIKLKKLNKTSVSQWTKATSSKSKTVENTVEGFLELLALAMESLVYKKELIAYYNTLQNSQKDEVEVYIFAQFEMTMLEYIKEYERLSEQSKYHNSMDEYSYDRARNNFQAMSSSSSSSSSSHKDECNYGSQYHKPSFSSSSSSSSSTEKPDIKLTGKDLENVSIEYLIGRCKAAPSKNSFLNVVEKYEKLTLDKQKSHRHHMWILLEQLENLPSDHEKESRDSFIKLYKARIEALSLSEYKEEIEFLEEKIELLEEERDRAMDHANFYEHHAYLTRKRQRNRHGSI